MKIKSEAELLSRTIPQQGPLSTPCLIWQGARNRGGYGVYNGGPHKTIRVHRTMWEHRYGQIAEGMHICHKCDVRACCNVDHMFIGSNADNTADKVAKGRQTKGSKIGRSKLTESQVSDIKSRLARGEKQAAIAAIYGVVQCSVADINTRRTWRHVSGEP